MFKNDNYIYVVCEKCLKVQPYYHYGNSEHLCRVNLYCNNCRQNHISSVIKDLDEPVLTEETIKVVSKPIDRFDKFTLEFQKESIKISFKKSKRYLKNLDKLTNSDVMEILNKHRTEKVTVIEKYRFEVNNNAEHEKDKYIFYINDVRQKAYKTKIRELLYNVKEDDIFTKDFNVYNFVNTHYKYSLYEKLMKISEYPYLEVLIKAGFLKNNVNIRSFENLLNKNGTDPQSIFEISKEKCNFLKESDLKSYVVDNDYSKFGDFAVYYTIFRKHPNIELKNLKKAIKIIIDNFKHFDNQRIRAAYPSLEQVATVLNFCKEHKLDLETIFIYLTTKAREEQGLINTYNNFTIYINMVRYAKEINVPFNKYPKSLILDHDRIAYLRILKEDELNKIAFEKNAKLNKIFEYENDTYCIISPKEMEELKTEGQLQGNCVGTYVDRYCNGISKIYFMRSIKDKELPLATIELNSINKVVQSKGKYNRQLTAEESKFVNEWLKNKVNTITTEYNKAV